jgi:hypothetical protein
VGSPDATTPAGGIWTWLNEYLGVAARKWLFIELRRCYGDVGTHDRKFSFIPQNGTMPSRESIDYANDTAISSPTRLWTCVARRSCVTPDRPHIIHRQPVNYINASPLALHCHDLVALHIPADVPTEKVTAQTMPKSANLGLNS